MNQTPPVDIKFEIRLTEAGIEQTLKAYEEIYEREGIRLLDSYYRWLLRMLKPVPGRRLLDVATGEGVLPNVARERFGLQAYGTDFSQVATRIAQEEGSAGFCVCTSETLPFPEAHFDYVTCIGSLEHFQDMSAALREMRRVLRPDGLALILVPNTYSILNNVYLALKTGMSIIDVQPLQRYAARSEWAMLFEASGLEVLHTAKYEREPPDSWEDLAWYLTHIRPLIRLMLAPFIPTNWATCLIYLCRRKDDLGQ